MQLFAPAKINLSFTIRGRRAVGFHEIETLMAPISLGDLLTVETESADHGIAFTCDDASLPTDETNLVVRAARLFYATAKREPQVRIALAKKIPHGAGLGGGSSDAASTLLALNELHGAQFSRAELLRLSAELGSDVPFFIHSSPAICRGRGEIVEPIALDTKLSLLLLKPAFGVPTPWAYQHWRESRELAGISYAPQEFGAISLVNDLERPVFEKYLFLAEMKMWLLAQPEVAAALMSGSGSTVFAILRDPATDLAERARVELDPELWTCAGETLPATRPRSP